MVHFELGLVLCVTEVLWHLESNEREREHKTRLAQTEEQTIEIRQVAGSIPASVLVHTRLSANRFMSPYALGRLRHPSLEITREARLGLSH